VRTGGHQTSAAFTTRKNKRRMFLTGQMLEHKPTWAKSSIRYSGPRLRRMQVPQLRRETSRAIRSRGF
jgi:hypothetical protein